MIHYAIVGCGYSGGIHAQSIGARRDAKLVAVYDTCAQNAQRLAKTYGARVASDLRELCADPQVDAVFVTTPNNSHVQPALYALEHGKHVLCEKPVSLSLADTKMMVNAARKADRLLFAGHVSNYIRGVQLAAQLLRDGAIGQLLMVQAVHCDWAGPQPTVGWKQTKVISGGHLYHHMHEVDLICQFAGVPQNVYALGKNLAHHGAGFGDEDDAVMLLMELQNGGVASLQIGSAFHQSEHSVRLQGSTGGILLDFRASCLTLDNQDGEQMFGLHESSEEDEERAASCRKVKKDAGTAFGRPGMKTSQWMQSIFTKEFEAFHALVSGGAADALAQTLTDGRAALACAAVLEAAERSMQSGKRIDIKGDFV